ncbi:HAD-IC family P-type ATPase [Patescibacteria group bacterium]|nr:HAD-IC family P-type ATPase [Patescibacteria group bacterium]
MSEKEIAWHSLSSAQVLKNLDSSEKGLSSQEAKKRLTKYGFNLLAKSKHFSAGALFFSQFKSALVYVLIIAGFISLFFGEYIDSYVIFLAVIINVIVGFIQEFKANKSLEKLNEVVKQETIVFRDGQELKIESHNIVVGDIIILESGNRVPADARLILANDLEVDEATLTGESWPVKKKLNSIDIGTVLAERTNMVFMGTLVVEGRAKAVVVNTGFTTEMGKITVLLKETEDEKTPLQERLDNFARSITKIIVVIAIFLFIFGILKGQEWSHMFTLAVAVAVSAIPEGLIIGMTMILTVGMQRILKHNGLVRRLISAETLGSTTVICTDKTGTLTEGEMRVTSIITSSHRFDLSTGSLKDILSKTEIDILEKISFLCNDSSIQNIDQAADDWSIIGSPTEKALIIFSANNSNVRNLSKEHPRVQEIPFDSGRKFMITRHHFDTKRDIIFIKGAPEKILSFSDFYQNDKKVTKISSSLKKRFDEDWQNLSKEGLRVLAGAYRLVPKDFKDFEKCKDNPNNFIFVGIWGLSDPLRPEAKETLQKTLAAGINTVIITGDNKFTAKSIAKELGLPVSDNSIVTGDELLQMTDGELSKRIRDIKLYARVTPADKLRIIKAWQSKGEVVSMTGDGVNDAPALKAADTGVAVSSGSDIAKETADLVLLDNNFSTIVMAVKQGRVIFSNLKKLILYLLSDAFSEVILITGSFILGMPLPILAAQILWVNLVDDGFPALALTMEPEEEEIMNKKPDRGSSLLDFESKFIIMMISFLTGSASLLIFWFISQNTHDEDLARTVTFTFLAISTLCYVFSIKSLENNIFRSHPFNNKYLNGAVFIGLITQLAAVYLPFFNKFLRTKPIGFYEWQVIILSILFLIVLIEISKFIFIKYNRKFSK